MRPRASGPTGRKAALPSRAVALEQLSSGEAGDGRNVVIRCDGTGNEVSGDMSNVLRLFRIAAKSIDQRVYYDPGVGAIGAFRRSRSRAA